MSHPDLRPLFKQITKAPRLFRTECATEVYEALLNDKNWGNNLQDLCQDKKLSEFLKGVFSCSPYLGRLAGRYPEALFTSLTHPQDQTLASVLTDLQATVCQAEDKIHLACILREAKARLHLLCALADLGGVWDWGPVTSALSSFADTALQSALYALARFEHEKGRMNQPGFSNPVPGFFIIALGKLGSYELNYSSDIDLAVFYQYDKLALSTSDEPVRAALRLTRHITRLFEDITEDGYVFRTDLRLRPDPGSSAPAVSVRTAQHYYQTLGQNWERAALIKARPCAGDEKSARTFLKSLKPYIWRRALDYAAISDIHAIKRQIQVVGSHGPIHPAGHNIKLGRGGIREIEFFTQVQQLILGVRQPDLQQAQTCKALEALGKAGFVSRETVRNLQCDYGFLRHIEHRLHMLDDEQTHTIPENSLARKRLARFCGYEQLADFEDELEARLRRVHGIYSRLFAEEETLASHAGSLVFTGVEPDAETLKTLEGLGFRHPENAWYMMSNWLGGRVRATRTERARSLLTKLAPKLVDAVAETGQADLTFVRFADFFASLTSGVTLLSLFLNQPILFKKIVKILALAPSLAPSLAQHPSLMDRLIEQDFSTPLKYDDHKSMEHRMIAALETSSSFEDSLDQARSIGREEQFRIGCHTLFGWADARMAGEAYAHLADISVKALTTVARKEMERLHGVLPADFAVLALGSWGGRELTAESDLDLMTIYSPHHADAVSDGPSSLATSPYFTRLTRRLLSALSAPTREGILYKTDMQLRPSGKAGPVSTLLTAFERYYRENAQIWELMALTRARVVSAPPDFTHRLETSITNLLAQPRDKHATAEDVASMGEHLRHAYRTDTIWSLKHVPGGLVDLAFIVQYLQLIHAAQHPDILQPSILSALKQLYKCGVLEGRAASFLRKAARLQLNLAQILGVAREERYFQPDTAPDRLKTLLARSTGFSDFETLEIYLARTQENIQKIYQKTVLSATEKPASSV